MRGGLVGREEFILGELGEVGVARSASFWGEVDPGFAEAFGCGVRSYAGLVCELVDVHSAAVVSERLEVFGWGDFWCVAGDLDQFELARVFVEA